MFEKPDTPTPGQTEFPAMERHTEKQAGKHLRMSTVVLKGEIGVDQRIAEDGGPALL